MAAPGTRLRQLAQRRAAEGVAGGGAIAAEGAAGSEACELCGAVIAPEHRHVVDVTTRQLLCACRACVILFDTRGAGGGHFRLVPERRLLVEDFELDDARWLDLRIPVDMAFFFHSTPVGRVVAFYPSPMGATESLLELESWQAIAAANPVLAGMEPDVEALLVDRAHASHRHWIVPIDDAYALVGLIRTRWRGLSGGKEVWEDIARHFEELGRRARTVTRYHGQAPAPAVAGGGAEERT